MQSIPKAALWLGLAGLIPFLAGVFISLGGEIEIPEGSYPLIVPNDGLNILASYGVVILSFMSGVLWGFAARPDQKVQPLYLALSVIPALYCFFFAWAGPIDERLLNLLIGFVGLLCLDYLFSVRGLAPGWWLSLRISLTVVVCGCLAIGSFS